MLASSNSFRSAHRPAVIGVRSGRIGVLLVNLGTPEATDYWSMRRYLKEFLSDRRSSRLNRLPVVADPQSGDPVPGRPQMKRRDYEAISTRSATRAR